MIVSPGNRRFVKKTKAPQALRFVSASGFMPTGTRGMDVPTAAPVANPQFITRSYFIIGSGDVSEIALSWFAWYHLGGSGVLNLGNGYTIEECAIEYNGVSRPIYFAGSRVKVITNGDTDIQSDAILPGTFGAASFTRGSVGYLRYRLSFTAGTAVMPGCSGNLVGGNVKLKFDPAKVIIINGVDSTGEIDYTMTGGGVNGTDALFCNENHMVPAVLGKFTTGNPTVMVFVGDSKTHGDGDTYSSVGGSGLGRSLLTSPTVTTGAFAGWNMGVSGGAASDWTIGTPSKMTAYIKYAKHAVENYGTNALDAAGSINIHTTLRANGIAKIVRTSLTPRTTSTDSFATEANQTIAANWGPSSQADTFENAMLALVDANFTYVNTKGVRGVSYWKWIVNAAAFYSTDDGLHQNATGYEFTVNSGSDVTRNTGLTVESLRTVIGSL